MGRGGTFLSLTWLLGGSKSSEVWCDRLRKASRWTLVNVTAAAVEAFVAQVLPVAFVLFIIGFIWSLATWTRGLLLTQACWVMSFSSARG